MVSGLCHVSLCCGVGRDLDSPARTGWVRAGLWSSPAEEMLLQSYEMKRSGYQKAGGGEQVAKHCFGGVLPAILGCCPGTAQAGPAKGRCSCAALSSSSKQAQLPHEPDKQRKNLSGWRRLPLCLFGERSLCCLGASSPWLGRCPRASCSAFCCAGRVGVGAVVAEGGLHLPALSPSPGLHACCSKQL